MQTCFVSSFEDNLQRFWEIEEVPATKHERRCEEHFNSTTRRSPEGRFIVKLPFKKEIAELVDSQQQARRRLRSLLHRLQKQPDLCRRYSEFIQEFIKLGHMEEVPANEMLLPNEKSYYLSIHCVFKDSSTTTKMRVVFDGSAKTTSGISLNDRLMVEPKIQKDLFNILIRFRMYHVALSADIAKMYRQVQLDAEDKDYHQLLWKEPNSTDIKTLRMTRVTYGIASSAFHSVRPLQVLAEDVTDKNVQLGIMKDMYLDDLLTGAPDLESAMKLQDSIIAVLSEAGFEIRKWTSSNPELVERLPANFRETTDEMSIKSEDYSIKNLGVKWNPNPDHFKKHHLQNAKYCRKSPGSLILWDGFDVQQYSSSLLYNCFGWTDLDGTKLCRKAFSNSTDDSEFN